MAVIHDPSRLDNRATAQVFSIAALFETTVTIDWLEELTGLKPLYILEAMETGVKQRLIKQKRPGIYYFQNEKDKQHYKNLIEEKECRKIHHKVAEIYIRDFGQDRDKSLSIANHLMFSQNDLEGCRWITIAAEQCTESGRSKEAQKYYIKALEDLFRLSGESEDRFFIETTLKYAKSLSTKENLAQVIFFLEQGIIRAKKREDLFNHALLEMNLSAYEWYRTHYNDAIKHFLRAHSICCKIKNPKLQSALTNLDAFFLFFQGHFREAISNYEKSLPDIETALSDGFPLIAAEAMACCYINVGQVVLGLGMLDIIRKKHIEKGNTALSAQPLFNLGIAMLNANRADEAIELFDKALRETQEGNHFMVDLFTNIALSWAYLLKGEVKKSVHHLEAYLMLSEKTSVTMDHHGYLLNLCWAIEENRLPEVNGLSIDRQIKKAILQRNIFIKGIAYRYSALIGLKKNHPREKIMKDLLQSARLLEESGHQIEIARTQLEIARQYAKSGENEKLRAIENKITESLLPIGEEFIPDDLKFLAKRESNREQLLEEILKLGHDLVTIRGQNDLIQRILTSSISITQAERGAIFLVDNNSSPPSVKLRASKNITIEDIEGSDLKPAIKMINEVAATGEGQITAVGNESTGDKGACRRICVPMILRDKIYGVIYHENSLFGSPIKKADLKILSYFAGQIAIALDNSAAYEEIKRLNEALQEEKRYYIESQLYESNYGKIIGKSRAIQEVYKKIDKVARTDTNVLILGETGVGKEIVARTIHERSLRASGPFIQINCGAFPHSLISGELFGHEKGSFTGATHLRRGRFELSHKGSLFLDEIGELPLEVQVLLLRVLQSHEFERLGGQETLFSDFRLIAATNRNLEDLVEKGRFRADLFYRLNVFPITVPPLVDRKEDIPLLATHFLRIYANKTDKKALTISNKEMEKLIEYHWPGNVRELENIIERGTILSNGKSFIAPQLGQEQEKLISAQQEEDLTLSENERRHIIRVLEKSDWRIRGAGGAAQRLDLPPTTLHSRMKKLNITKPLRN